MKTVVILTMPRSGSSLLAGILHRLGVWMGEEEDLNVGRHLNKYGCYENQSFIALNENILFQAKRLVDHSRRLNDDDGLVESAVKSYEGKIKNLIRNNERELWGFKNPTIIYTLSYFHQHLNNPYYIRIISVLIVMPIELLIPSLRQPEHKIGGLNYSTSFLTLPFVPA